MATEVLGVQAVFSGGTPAFGGCYVAGVGGWLVWCRGWEITIFFSVVMGSRRR
jgi:hypothetical protein